jgi:hypothetical protein
MYHYRPLRTISDILEVHAIILEELISRCSSIPKKRHIQSIDAAS